jgi:hypothetical protein|tara:strand:- start:2509 stop:3120 length:612 start_codon:yes stop_codon:yes gene_type:complete
MRKTRMKKYLLFMFGAWIKLEDNVELYQHIKDVLETVLAAPELSFVTGEHTLIACIESYSSFNEVKSLLEEFLKPDIPAYFLMPKPRNLSYRLNPLLEQHLFSKNNIKKSGTPPPEMIKELMDYFKKRALNNMDFLKHNMELSSIKEKYNPNTYKNTKIGTLDVDTILDKISRTGIGSITLTEKEFLDKQKKDGNNTIYRNRL